MSAVPQQSEEFQRYFSSLPLNVQETIKQTSVDVKSVDDLRRFAENLMKGPTSAQ